MTQSIVVQVGQCGNQIGCRFWDLALREHAAVSKSGLYDESIGSFFRNVDSRYDDPADIPLGTGRGKIRSLKARAVLVDMEEGVVNEMMKGPLKEVFDFQQLITDVSGAGNNWAVGHKMYGTQYKEKLTDVIRRAAEFCDCLQCFFVIHSMGGGTGSGVGTFILNLLEEEYPDIYRFVTAVYPSAEDDVITSPYNSVLAMRELTEKADCVLPVENQALMDIVNKVSKSVPSLKTGKKTFSGLSETMKAGSAITTGEGGTVSKAEERPFDSMNNIVANLLLNMTSSARFEGSLNVDLNEITMNLVPFPRLHYLVSSQSPLYAIADVKLPPRRLDQMFSDAFSKDHQLLRSDPKRSLYLACALMVRGNVEISDVRRNIDRLKPNLQFIHWNQEGWKTGLCSVAPVGQPYSLLTLANNTCVHHTFTDLKDRFVKLYKRKAHIHHYTHIDGMELSDFSDSLECLNTIITDYRDLERQLSNPPPTEPRLQVMT
ncbi:tubulin epsilon chain-like [Mizuhopecten yessoensis]|uniref:Tubulin epsilon chain n=1 Tax=Mizuhopecten yessoensis TaxID=6573 RepID=A0A210PHK0_MIZYE|nr:tubulin epsilon chain-like [Mizuhopecten yessoensis]OWF35961.1 Tubulin epsilon chain [Mizuhopecten yessoensis]